MKRYLPIKEIRMAGHNDIYEVLYDTSPLEDIKEGWVTAEEMEDSGLFATKASAMEWSEDAPVTGYGTHSGRKLWQLPTRLRREISKLLTKRHIPA